MSTKDIWEGLGSGYQTKDGRICMIRCFVCGKENYAMAVSSGFCANCGYDANSPNKNGQDKVPAVQESED